MRRAGWLSIVPALAVAAVIGVIAGGGDGRWARVEELARAAKAMALFGALLAALTFRRGDYLRGAWLMIALTYGVLLERDAIIHRNLIGSATSTGMRAFEGWVVLCANLCGVAGTWLMARAWRRAGLELPGSRLTRKLVRAAAVVLALGITVPSLKVHIEALVGGDAHAMVGVASTLGDVVGLSLIAPVLLTAVALRGGPVAMPWAFFTGSLLAWLFFDATLVVSALVSSEGLFLRGMAEVFRVLACSLACVAGVAQRLSAPDFPEEARARVRSTAR